MKKGLICEPKEVYYIENGVKIIGVHKQIFGDVSGISGNVTGIRGVVTWISGCLDDCAITDDERNKGIDINELIKLNK